MVTYISSVNLDKIRKGVILQDSLALPFRPESFYPCIQPSGGACRLIATNQRIEASIVEGHASGCYRDGGDGR